MSLFQVSDIDLESSGGSDDYEDPDVLNSSFTSSSLNPSPQQGTVHTKNTGMHYIWGNKSL